MKKKNLLAVTCVITSALLLCSCGNSFVNEAKKNPTKTVIDSFSVASESVVSESPVFDTVVPALTKGTVSVKVPYEEADVNVTLYNDEEANKAALVFLAGEDSIIPGFGVYANKSELSVECEHLLGETAYGVDFKTLYDDLSKWGIWEEIGIEFAEFEEEYGEQAKALFDFIANPEKVDEINKKELAKLVKTLDKYAKVENTEGAVVVTYDLKAKDINEVVDMCFNWGKQYYEKIIPDYEEYGEEITAAKYFENNYVKDYAVSVSVHLNEKTKDLMKFEVSSKYTKSWPVYGDKYFEEDDETDVTYENDPYEYSFLFDFGEGLTSTNKCDLVVSVTENDYETEKPATETISMSFVKNDSEDKLECKLTATNGEETKQASLLINKKDKTFELTGDEDLGITSVSGTYAKDDGSLIVTFKSIMEYSYYDEEEYNILEDIGEFSITFTKGGRVEFPKYVKITDLTTEDLQALALDVMTTLGVSGAEDEYYDDDYNHEYDVEYDAEYSDEDGWVVVDEF